MTPDIPTYVLHYQPNTDRKLFMQHLLDLEKFTNYTWITEYDRETVTYDDYVDNFRADILEYHYRKPTDFEALYPLRACEVSLCLKHKLAMTKFLQTDAEMCLILEDDAVLDRDFVSHITQYIDQLPKDWGVAFIGDADLRIPQSNLVVGQHWYRCPLIHAPKCTDSILWSRQAVDTILKSWQMRKICMPSDHEIGYWIRVFDMPAYWLEPPMCVQGSHLGLFNSMQLPNGWHLNPNMPVRSDISEILQSLNLKRFIDK